ncbi:MAG: ABC transporter permease [Candidatus Schekmanbacteria bacterium]|nr:ABC transporter permease [Candidatus Schekmanbacteria bacterium]
MAQYLLRRLLWSIPVVLGVATLVFALIHIVPGDPIDIMLGEQAAAVDREALRRELGLDRPRYEQYGRFLGGLLQGDLGASLTTRRPVVATVLKRYPATLELAVAAMVICLVVAVPLGTIAAVHRGGALDRVTTLVALVGVSMPNFWLGPLLILAFSIHLDWLPVSGRGSVAHLVLPAVTLGTSMAALVARMVRSSLLEVLSAGYVATAAAKGLPRWRVVTKHALRNALIPVVTIIGLQIGALLAGAVVTEKIYSWPGIGGLIITAIGGRDYPLVQGCVLAIALTYVFVNLLTDLAYTLVDPRIDLAGGRRV